MVSCLEYYFIRSFPVNYWDKFVKKKVRQKYSETYDFDSISNLLGMEKTSFQQQESDEGKSFIYLYVSIRPSDLKRCDLIFYFSALLILTGDIKFGNLV
jgi:hypothetical protein